MWQVLALYLVFAGPVFEVASVKPSPPASGNIVINLGRISHGEVTLENATLSECVQFAYGLSSEDLIAGPDWIRDRSLRVDIIGKAAAETPREQLLQMLQNLLAERFHLQTHREPRPLAHFELTAGAGAAKLTKSKETAPGAVLVAYGRGHLNYRHLSMDRLAMLLSRQLKEVVVDQTGLQGYYDVDLKWAPEDAPADAAPLPDIYTAVREQLGLTLQARKTPVETLVIDRADKIPSGN